MLFVTFQEADPESGAAQPRSVGINPEQVAYVRHARRPGVATITMSQGTDLYVIGDPAAIVQRLDGVARG